MTEIEKKALALVNEVAAERGTEYPCVDRRNDARWEALCRAIEQHEAYKQDVSDMLVRRGYNTDDCGFGRFIIPEPTVDPLVEVLAECDWLNSPTLATDFREALAKRGLKIVEAGQ